MKKWLFNPFEMIAGWTSAAIGAVIVLSTAMAAAFAGVRLDGVIDLHIGSEATILFAVFEGLVDWFCMALFIFIAGVIFSRSTIRLIDVIGTQGMARFPFLPVCLYSLLPANEQVVKYIKYHFLRIGSEVVITPWDLILFALGVLLTLLAVIWMVVLMYRAYSISCNVKGSKGIVSFIGALLLAEILSKLILFLI